MRPLSRKYYSTVTYVKPSKIKLDINGNTVEKDVKYKQYTNIHCGDSIKELWPVIPRNENPKDRKLKFVVEFEDKLIQSSSHHIGWCDQTSQWELSDKIVEGIYGPDLIGSMLYNEFMTVTAYETLQHALESHSPIYILDERVAKELGYIPSRNGNYFVLKKRLSSDDMKKLQTLKGFNLPINTTHNADSDNYMFQEIIDIHKKVEKNIYKPTIIDRYAADLLNGLTFGLEFETGKGTLQKSALGTLGLIPLIDGSLSSRDQFEYTTIPLQGAYGLDTLKRACERLQMQCIVDHNCALHVHIGTLPSSDIFIVSLYHLFERIQEDLFAMVPEYKKDEITTLGKAKNYSAPIRSIGIESNTIFSKKDQKEFNAEVSVYKDAIFDFISCGKKLDKHLNSESRKQGNIRTPWSRQWRCPTRYFAMNIVNYFFSKSGTVEFRLHGPSLNFTKVSCWLFICAAIIRYAEKYPQKILNRKSKITLNDVIEEYRTNFGTTNSGCGKRSIYYAQFTDYLLGYIKERTTYFREQYVTAYKQALENENRNGIVGQMALNEFANDHKYKFKTEQLENLY